LKLLTGADAVMFTRAGKPPLATSADTEVEAQNVLMSILSLCNDRAGGALAADQPVLQGKENKKHSRS